MTHYTDIDSFLDRLATDVEAGIYQKSTFPNALSSDEWMRLLGELADRCTPVKQSHIAPFQYIGILTTDRKSAPYTYSRLALGIRSRLELMAFAKEHITAFTSPKH